MGWYGGFSSLTSERMDSPYVSKLSILPSRPPLGSSFSSFLSISLWIILPFPRPRMMRDCSRNKRRRDGDASPCTWRGCFWKSCVCKLAIPPSKPGKERKQQMHIFLHCTNLWFQVYTLQNMTFLFQIKKKRLKKLCITEVSLSNILVI